MSTQSYYKDRLGFDPADLQEMSNLDPTLQYYEESLSKFKDERDAIQKKTFTKWVNKHLWKRGKRIDDLFNDLRDGENLVSLLEVLTGEPLPRERGRLRFHMIQNVQTCLNYLRYKKIKVVNIRAEDIVDANQKLTLGLIWTIILHFQISDVVARDVTVSAKDALLMWAQRSVAKYPGVRVRDFTSSWRDGLAFNALIHRNRPDLIDWRALKNKGNRERLDYAFHIVERECGVTRLLDSEDVDTAEPDEKSLITYISSLYDVFPEPPAAHPLYDPESERLYTEYRETASSLHAWIRENTRLMQDPNMPNTVSEVSRLATDCERFRTKEVPMKQIDKQRLFHIYPVVKQFIEDTEEPLEAELKPDALERYWNQLMRLCEARIRTIHDELERLEKLHRIAERLHRETKVVDGQLTQIEERINEEYKKLNRVSPQETRENCELISTELESADDSIKKMFAEVQILKEGRYSLTSDLHKRVQKVHQRWLSLQSVFQTQLSSSLSTSTLSRQARSTLETRLFDSNELFHTLRESLDWVRLKLKQMEDAEYGSDLASVEAQLEFHNKEFTSVKKFQVKLEKCLAAKAKLTGEELVVYSQHLSQLQKTYNELVVVGEKRSADLEQLLAFISAATVELIFLSEKEEVEVSRDWASDTLNIRDLERYTEAFMNELEHRERQIGSIHDQGESLILQRHPAAKCVEAYLAALTTQWDWLLQLTMCLQTHLRYAADYWSFWKEVEHCEQWCTKQEELLNTVFSQNDFSLDEGEKLLREMQDLRESLSQYGEAVTALLERSHEIVPLAQRKQPCRQPTDITAVCNYKQGNVQFSKGDACKLLNNANISKWNVLHSNGVEIQAPSVCFLIPPPDRETEAAADRLKLLFDRCVGLWQAKQLRMRQNMILTTIKVVKNWDLEQFMAMEKEQRDAIRKALNEDAEKLLQEGDASDLLLQRLQKEIEEVNQLFEEYESIVGGRSDSRTIDEQLSSLYASLQDAELALRTKAAKPLPRDVQQLDQNLSQHKAFENELQTLEPELESIKNILDKTTRKSPLLQSRLDSCVEKWSVVWASSHLLYECLKGVEIVLSDLQEATDLVSQTEVKLVACSQPPADVMSLKTMHKDLRSLQTNVQSQDGFFSRLKEDIAQLRTSVQKSRNSTSRKHVDVDSFDGEAESVISKWQNICTQIGQRIQSCETSLNLLDKYNLPSRSGIEIGSEVMQKAATFETSSSYVSKPNTAHFAADSEDIGNLIGAQLIREAQMAVEQQAQSEQNKTAELLSWMSQLETQLVEQVPLKEDPAELQSQISVIRGMRDELECRSQLITDCVEELSRFAAQGADVLSQETATYFKESQLQLKSRHERLSEYTDKLLRKLNLAQDELVKYRAEYVNFASWLKSATQEADFIERSVLSDFGEIRKNSEGLREFVGDVASHQADLRFITMAAKKVSEESNEYLNLVSDFRRTLPNGSGSIQQSHSKVSQDVSEISTAFHSLLHHLHKLQEKVSAVAAKQKVYEDSLERAIIWMDVAESSTNKIVNHPLETDTVHLEEQLSRAKALHSELVANERLIDNVKQAVVDLFSVADPESPQKEFQELETQASDVEFRYRSIAESLAGKIQAMDASLMQSQGVLKAIDSFTAWLDKAENQFRFSTKPASLLPDRLDEQLKENRILLADVQNHTSSLETIHQAAEKILDTSRTGQKLDTTIKEISSRFAKLQEAVENRNDFLDDVFGTVESFTSNAEEFKHWHSSMVAAMTSLDVADIDADQMAAEMEEIGQQRDSKQESFSEIVNCAKDLISRPEVTDTAFVKESVKELENSWSELNDRIENNMKGGRALLEKMNAYETLRNQVQNWLNNTENSINQLEPVGLVSARISVQLDELKPLLKELEGYGAMIDRVAELGYTYEALTQKGRADIFHGSLSSPGRKPSKGEGKGPVRQELDRIFDRYASLEDRLTRRRKELEEAKEESSKLEETLNSLAFFLDRKEKQLPAASAPQSKEDAEKQLSAARSILESMAEKQPQLDELNNQVNVLLKKRPDAAGTVELTKPMEAISIRWKSLHDSCKRIMKFFEAVKEFHDTHDQLLVWLNAKDRMMSVLGPIASDPRLVHNQLQQVQVLKEEFKVQEPYVQNLHSLADSILKICEPTSPDGRRVNDKVAVISAQWSSLIDSLNERKSSLDAASGASRQFYANLGQIQDELHKMSDELENLAMEKAQAEESLQRFELLEQQLATLRPAIAEAEAVGEQLCAIVCDGSTKSEIEQKIHQVEKLYNQLQKKLDNRKAETENIVKGNREFAEQCDKFQHWLQGPAALVRDKLQVSADRERLRAQLQENEPLYREVTSKEHEVVMMLDRGRDLAAYLKDAGASFKFLENLRNDWYSTRQNVLDRYTRLQTCAEICRKYDNALEVLLPWLQAAEDKIAKLGVVPFAKTDLDRQTKQLQSLRNDVLRQTASYESTKSLGDSFLSSCDVEKDAVQCELNSLRERWEVLNQFLQERSQILDDTSYQLAKFTEQYRDVQHALQRCEDRVASHDALGSSARDAKFLDRVKSILEEVAGLETSIRAVQETAGGLLKDAEACGSDASHIDQQTEDLYLRHKELKGHLENRCSSLESESHVLTQFKDQLTAVTNTVATLQAESETMAPAGRDLVTLESQLEQAAIFMRKLEACEKEIEAAVSHAENLTSQGLVHDNRATRDQLEELIKKAARLDERNRDRLRALKNTKERLEVFYTNYSEIMPRIDEMAAKEKTFKAVGSDVEVIRVQLSEFRSFLNEFVNPLGKEVDQANEEGRALVQTAANGVSTAVLESDLEKMNDRWNSLKECINERERKLDAGLLQFGKFMEALEGLSKWLSDTEEMVANQKPPSPDYKVVKAQLQEQKFLKKLLVDRQYSMSSLVDMGRDISYYADKNENIDVAQQLQELLTRFENLSTAADQRMAALQSTIGIAKEFQEKYIPILDWLEKKERRIRELQTVPTDEVKIDNCIDEHNVIHDEILDKNGEFDHLTDLATVLMGVVGDEEAAALADRLTELTDRFGSLVENSEAVGNLLSNAKRGLRTLVLTYEDLLGWMEDMEQRLGRYRVLSVHVEKLQEQMEELVFLIEEVTSHQQHVDSVVDIGLELMRHITNEEAVQLKDKLDFVQRRYSDLTGKASDLLNHAQETLPLVEQFHVFHNRLSDWLVDADTRLQAMETAAGSNSTNILGVHESEIDTLESELSEARGLLDTVNVCGPQLCQHCPGEGAASIESLITRDNRRFDAISEKIQRKAERLHFSKQRSLEVVGDLDDLLDWFRETESQLREAEAPSLDPEVIRVQLKEHKVLGEEITCQRSRVRDVISASKRVLREGPQHEDADLIREKLDDLKDFSEHVSRLSVERLSVLEQALPLAEHFYDVHSELAQWLDEVETDVYNLEAPAIRADHIIKQQEVNKELLSIILEQKSVVDQLNKTGSALSKLCTEEDNARIQELVDSDNARYASLRANLRERQQLLEEALQETSQFSDRLDGMLSALTSTFDQVKRVEPVSAHPDKLHEQLMENHAVLQDLQKRETAFDAVRRAADEVISKAGSPSDPAIKDVKGKMERLSNLWDAVLKATSERGKSLDETLSIAERFWDELQSVLTTLRDVQQTLVTQEPAAVEPRSIQLQQEVLHEIKNEIDQTKPEVEQCRLTGQELINLCGEPDKPEVKKHIDELDMAWDNVTALYAKREENLINAMEKAMEFHDTLQDFAEFLDYAEKKFNAMRPLGTDLDTVKDQILQLKNFKVEVDPHMVKIEALNRQASELTDRTSPEQAAKLKEPLGRVNRRWEELSRAVVERQRELEHALLRLGQFQHALKELLVWIDASDKTLEGLKPVFGDPSVIEVELAKLKVLVNDIQAHQTSVDTLNDAGRQLIEEDRGSDDANATQQHLAVLNKKWGDLLGKTTDRQKDLEAALKEAQAFSGEIQDMLMWFGDVDAAVASSKAVGGLPETASEQLERFMELYNELEHNRPKVESLLQQGSDYLKRSTAGAAVSLQHNLRSLKQRWDNLLSRANDKKIKLEIALKEATEFHEALQAFIEWLTTSEKNLLNLKPASRVMETVLEQIEDHKVFQKEVGVQRELMLTLDKKGTHLKYFSQKQDVILIKNLMVSVQNRWEKILSKASERTRSLDHAYKEAKEFHDAWSELYTWLEETEKTLDDPSLHAGKDPEKIKQLLAKHKEFQRALGTKQASFDAVLRLAKHVLDRASKADEPVLKLMTTDLKTKWQSLCNKSIDRQRKLEEALLFSGQFKEALQALLEWLGKIDVVHMSEGPVHGDLDTVTGLGEQHRSFEQELASRLAQAKQVRNTASELMNTSSDEDRAAIQQQIDQLNENWKRVEAAAITRSERLEQAESQAAQLHKAVNALLEWLSDAEMKLRFSGQIPDDELEVMTQIEIHEKFVEEMLRKESDKDATNSLAQEILAKSHPDAVTVIKHWMTIIQSRWDEVSAWVQQRGQRLEETLRHMRETASLLDDLMKWLSNAESSLDALESRPLPEEQKAVELLFEDHTNFMDNMAKRQGDVDLVCKPTQISRASMAVNPSKPKFMAAAENDLVPAREASADREVGGQSAGVVNRVTPDRERSAIPRLIRNTPRTPSRETTPTPQGKKPSADLPNGEKTSNSWPKFTEPVASPNRRGSKLNGEPFGRNPRSRKLWDKWRHVWIMAWERHRRLQDKLAYLKEIERVKNFSWDEWRRQFMRYMNNKKSRVTDLFRKLDKKNEGIIPREDFVEGIIRTKFPTSRIEMNAVASKFDKNGYVDWREFIIALRPDWEEPKPNWEAEKIKDEVQRQVQQCSCTSRFKVDHVGEGRYKFGDSQKLRLVRILRSSVMVRVGGGWTALDEFLVKNDPCRARGRTNFDIREHLFLAESSSSGITPFRTRTNASSSSSVSSQNGIMATPTRSTSTPSFGPITKVRELTDKSVPMNSSKGRFSFSVASPDASHSEVDGSFRLHGRKVSAPARAWIPGSSRPVSRQTDSRQGSRQASRHGSLQSLDGADGATAANKFPSSIRRTPSFHRGSASTSKIKTNGAAGSSNTLPRKGSTPTEGRQRTSSSSSGSGISPTTNGSANRFRIPRATSASNIPVLTSTPSRARPLASTPGRQQSTVAASPVFRTPSTSSIPVLVGSSSRTGISSRTAGTTPKLIRQHSATAETMTRSARKASAANVSSSALRKPSTPSASRK